MSEHVAQKLSFVDRWLTVVDLLSNSGDSQQFNYVPLRLPYFPLSQPFVPPV